EVWTYTYWHDVSQAEYDSAIAGTLTGVGGLSNGFRLDNIATVDTDQTGPQSDPASVPVESGPNQLGAFAGIKYVDLNGDGLLNPADDVAKSGVTIYLYRDNGSTAGELDGTDSFVATDVTDANGGYSFSGLTAGNYIVLEQVPTGWVESPDADT